MPPCPLSMIKAAVEERSGKFIIGNRTRVVKRIPKATVDDGQAYALATNLSRQ